MYSGYDLGGGKTEQLKEKICAVLTLVHRILDIKGLFNV